MSQENAQKEESSLVSFAREELKRLEDAAREDGEPCVMQQSVTKDVLEVLRVLSAQDHSGSSIGYTLNLVRKLAMFSPLTPLTGEDSEWMEVGDGYFQNVRCGHVFKNAEGRAYDLDGYVTVDPNGCCYTGGGILCYIEFPYTPKTQYLPRLSLLVVEDDQLPPKERIHEFLHSTKEAVLEFYERNDIVQPPEDEHVVKLTGSLACAMGPTAAAVTQLDAAPKL